MFWKNWPFWVRGGVVGGVLPILSFVLANLCIYFTTPPFMGANLGLQCTPFLFAFVPLWATKYFSFFETPLGVSVITYVFAGCVIGFVIGYFIKEKNPR
jgi:hypothetical protein